MSNHTAEFKGGSGTFLTPKRKLQFQQISKGAENSPTKQRKYNEQLNQKSTVSSCSSQWGPGKDVDQEWNFDASNSSYGLWPSAHNLLITELGQQCYFIICDILSVLFCLFSEEEVFAC